MTIERADDRPEAAASGEDRSSKEMGQGLRKRLGHRSELDGVRGVAVLVIVVYHSSALLVGSVDLSRWIGGAFLGVDIFFVLSGFLITALLLQEQDKSGRVHVLRFYGRRALRLLPALYFLLLVHFCYVYFTGLPRGPEVENVVGAALYYKNWIGVFHVDPALFLAPTYGASALVHLWSLSVEEQFYLLWPFVVIALLGLTRRTSTAVLTLGALLAAIVVYRWILYDRSVSFLALYSRTDTRADALIVGALLAVLWLRVGLPKRFAGVFGAAALVVVVVFITRVDVADPFLWKGGLTLFALAVAVVLHAVISSSWSANSVLRWRPLMLVGIVSYGVYLWHLPAFDVIARYGAEWPVIARVAAGIALTAFFVVLSWYLVEQPFLRLKLRLEPAGVESSGPVTPDPGVERSTA